MERLTFEGNFCDISRCQGEYRMTSECEDGACDARKVWEKLKAYEDTGLTPEICREYKKFEDEAVSKGVTFARIIELMEAEKDGRLFVPPVKVGDKVYGIAYDEVSDEYIADELEEIVEVGTKGFFLSQRTRPKEPDEFHLYEEIGKEFFLTLEDAERAKEKLEGESNG